MGYRSTSRRHRRREWLARAGAAGPERTHATPAAVRTSPERAGWNFAATPLRAAAGPVHVQPAKAAESARRENDLEPGTKQTGTIGAVIGGVLGGLAGALIGGLVGGIPGAILGGLGGALVGGAIGSQIGSSPTLSKSNDSYSDNATESRKNIRFDVGLPSGARAGDYALVNWVKGHMKEGGGGFFKVQMYGSNVDANFPSFQVDSMDADPVYWSDAAGRWNYTSTANGFYATDSPGPALATEHGAEYALKFQMGLYKLADVPTTTSGTIAATPLAMVPWDYSVKVDATGGFTHPSI